MKGERIMIINGLCQIWNREKLHFKIGSSLNSNRDLILILTNLKRSCWWNSWKDEKWAKSCWGWKRIKSKGALKFIWICQKGERFP